MHPTRSDHESLRACVLLALVYVAGVGAVHFRPDGGMVATWWPAAGFACALIILGAPARRGRYAAGVVLVSALANLSGGRDFETSVLFGFSNAAEALVVGLTLPHLRRGWLRAPENFFHLVRSATLGALTIGAGASATVWVTGGEPLVALRTVAPSHLASTLVILPLLLMRAHRTTGFTRLVELLGQSSLLLASVLLIFWPHQALALAFLPLPLLIWAALRFGPYVAAVQIFALAVLTTWLTARGGGPFAVGARAAAVDDMLAGAQVQIFLVSASLMTLTSALAAAQRRDLLRRLTAEEQLTSRTLEATAALIMVTDGEGLVLRTNPATAQITGFPEHALRGRPVWETPMIPPERVDLVRQMYADSDGTSVPGTREADVLTASGERRRIVWNNNIVRDEDGRVEHVVFTGSDVTRERTTSGMLRHLLEAPMDTSLVGLDPVGRITVFNRGAEQMLGLSTGEVLGRPVEDIVVSEQPREYLRRDPGRLSVRRLGRLPDQLLDLAETGDWTWRDAAGRALTVSTTISVVTDVTGETVGYLCVGRDVTETRRTQEMLVEALEKERHGVERLRRLDAAKNDFVSTVSHELRTPTTSIVGYTEMLLDGDAGEPPSAKQVPMLEAIARNGKRLIAVASDLLTLSELESDDAADWERSPVDLADTVAHGEEAVRSLLTRRDLEVSFETADGVVVVGDAAHLDRVLMNLLSNAIKFTPDGGRVRCVLRRCDAWAELVVSDTGIGIPTDEQGELFTKFFRSSTAQAHAIQGTGLGLSIISSIVGAHGGEIDVRSAHGEGTTFTVRLPLARQPAPRAVVRSG